MSSTAIAEAVCDRLNGLELEFEYAATRLVFPREKITEAETVTVTVFKGPRTSEEVTRGKWQKNYSVFVVVQKKLSSQSASQVAESDKLTSLIEAMELSFENDWNVAGYRLVGFDETVDRLPFSVELIRDTGLFSAFFGLVFRD